MCRYFHFCTVSGGVARFDGHSKRAHVAVIRRNAIKSMVQAAARPHPPEWPADATFWIREVLG